MAAVEELKSDNELEDSDGEAKGSQERGKKIMDQVAGHGATSVSVDQRTLEGRRANRGFTVAMGKTDASDGDGRRKERAQTLPSMGCRRGDYHASEETLAKLMKMREELGRRYRRGSIGVTYSVVPEAEFKECWTEHCTSFTWGTMTEGQQSGDERPWIFSIGDKLPGERPAIISCTKGSKGFRDTTPNQDNFSIMYLKNGWAFALCMDGHGPFGHLVSHRAVQTIPYYLLNSDNFPDKMETALVEAFERAQREVVAVALRDGWDPQASGSTAVAAVWKGSTVWTANLGDSRCVVGNETDRRMCFETEDHKPNSPTEHDRIHSNGGEVRSQTYPDGWTVHRIFVKGEDFPGLCMARTIGDESVKNHGVIATPEVKSTEVDLAAQPFLILASDGVWEFLESEFVVKAVAKKILSDGPAKTVQKLQREARKRWRQEEGDYCDDITSMLIQLR